MRRKDDKEDQPSGGETTWPNTGGTRSGNWRQHAEAFAQRRDNDLLHRVLDIHCQIDSSQCLAQLTPARVGKARSVHVQ